MKPEDVVTLKEIAAEHGLSLLTVRTWKTRYEDFPAPWRKGSAGELDLYSRRRIEAFIETRGIGHGRK
jgi:transposase